MSHVARRLLPRHLNAPQSALVVAVFAGSTGLIEAWIADVPWQTAGLSALALAVTALPVTTLFMVRNRSRSFVGAMSVGLWTGIVLAWGTWWLTSPPPFVPAAPHQGNIPVVLGLLITLSITVMVVARTPAAWLLALATSAFLVTQIQRTVRPPGSVLMNPDNPDVVLITLDTTRADHLGFVGDKVVKNPAFQQLASAGAMFNHAFSPLPVTGPSHTTMLTGSGPWDHGNLLNGLPLPAIPSLVEILAQNGWETGGFVSAMVLDGALGFARGFSVYDDHFGALPGLPQVALGRMLSSLGVGPALERPAQTTVDQALRWWKTAHRPRFLWVHLFDPHGPYTPPPPWDSMYYQGDPTDLNHTTMQTASGWAPYMAASLAGITDADWVKAQYAGEISYMDQELARLVQALDLENTLLVIAGDHGESLGEHGVWFNHGDDLHRESTQVPLVLHWPGRIRAQEVTTPVELGDVAPTMLALLDLPIPDTMTGVALGPVLQGSPMPRPWARALAFDRTANQQARRRGEITQPRYRMAAAYTEDDTLILHESVANPGTSSLFPVVKALFGGPTGTSFEDPRSAEVRQQLEALGYVE